MPTFGDARGPISVELLSSISMQSDRARGTKGQVASARPLDVAHHHPYPSRAAHGLGAGDRPTVARATAATMAAALFNEICSTRRSSVLPRRLNTARSRDTERSLPGPRSWSTTRSFASSTPTSMRKRPPITKLSTVAERKGVNKKAASAAQVGARYRPEFNTRPPAIPEALRNHRRPGTALETTCYTDQASVSGTTMRIRAGYALGLRHSGRRR